MPVQGIVKNFISTTVGKKIVMAVTGLVLITFVVGHMAGNLKMFAGIDPVSGKHKLDLYAVFLREIAAGFLGHETFLWIFRAILLLCLILHVSMAIQLSALNRKAKPIKPQRQWFGSSNPASRTMLFGGLFLFFFIIYHILHFTTGTVHHHGFVHGAVYANVYAGFQNPATAGFYILAMGALALHMYHGIWSVFQTLGVDTPAWNCGIRGVAKLLSVILFIGFISVPVSVVFKLVPPPSVTAISSGSSHP